MTKGTLDLLERLFKKRYLNGIIKRIKICFIELKEI